jgi:hypothetical protein
VNERPDLDSAGPGELHTVILAFDPRRLHFPLFSLGFAERIEVRPLEPILRGARFQFLEREEASMSCRPTAEIECVTRRKPVGRLCQSQQETLDALEVTAKV